MLREITNFVRILPPNNMRRILLLICLFVILVTPAVAQLYQYLDTQNGDRKSTRLNSSHSV